MLISETAVDACYTSATSVSQSYFGGTLSIFLLGQNTDLLLRMLSNLFPQAGLITLFLTVFAKLCKPHKNG